MKQIHVTITGMTPLMMHSDRLANPFDPITKEMKTLTGKRKKTEDDLLAIAKLEWNGGIYHDATVGPFVPGYNVFATIINGGKIHKLGTSIKRAALVLDDKCKVEYAGPRDLEPLFADSRFVDMRGVKVGTAKVTRCRPIFNDWKLSFTMSYDEASLQRDDLVRSITDAGRMVGLGDYRPRFGRFDVTEVRDV
jgi:hypothetical protein